MLNKAHAKHVSLATIVAAVALLYVCSQATAMSIEHQPNTDKVGGIAGMPPRIEKELAPGESEDVEFRFQNRTGKALSVAFSAIDIEGSKQDTITGLNLTDVGAFGAKTWMKPEVDSARLAHGDIVTIVVKVSVPEGTSPGSHYAAVVAEVSEELKNKGSTDEGITIGTKTASAVATQLFINVSGAEKYGGKIRSAKLPGLHWYGSSPRINGRIVYENTGNTTDVVGGVLTFEGLTGGIADEVPLKRLVVLRGAAREYSVTWNDLPWIGRFKPKVKVVGRTGEVITKELPPIWILPPWYYFVALVMAIIFPFAFRARQNRKMAKWLAAELERRGLSPDDDFDEDELFSDDEQSE